jgi:hypothetical protein
MTQQAHLVTCQSAALGCVPPFALREVASSLGAAGDQRSSSLPSTTSRSREHTASLAGFGRRTARRSAAHARYRSGPPFAAASRHTVDGARPTVRAIARTDHPAARPREISSCSASDNLSADRCGSRLAGRYSATTARRIACRDRLISLMQIPRRRALGHQIGDPPPLLITDLIHSPHLRPRSNSMLGGVLR